MTKQRFLVASAVLVSLVGHSSARGQDPSLVTDAIVPAATGTISFLPELGILRPAPIGNAIQSTYRRSTALNREFRRGFLEFSIPDFDGSLESATLVLTEQRATSSFPQPPDIHELGSYDADLVVDTSDYDVSTSPVAEFETDSNLEEQSFSFVITALVNQYKGRKLGLRIKLSVGPDYFGEGFLGTGIQSGSQGSPARIILVRSNTTEQLPPDSDQDGILDTDDNCTLVPNPGWCDSDEDGYGNFCDGDLTNDGITNGRDVVILRNLLGTETPGPWFSSGDLNCDGAVDYFDPIVLRQLLGQPPGPSGLVP